MFQQNTIRRLRRVLTPLLLFVASATNAGEGHQRGLPNDPTKTADMAFKIKTVALQNRVKLAYVEQGEPSGMPVVLLHGYTDSWHSLGSYIAQCFAMNYPERTLGLVLVGAFTTLRSDKGIQEFWDTAVSKLEDPIDPSLAKSQRPRSSFGVIGTRTFPVRVRHFTMSEVNPDSRAKGF